jgi:hypothetical protein
MATTVDFSPTAADGHVGTELASWAAARGAASGTAAASGADFSVCSWGPYYSTYGCYRGFLAFDTSAIPDTAVIESAVLLLRCVTAQTYTVHAVESTQANPAALAAADFARVGSTSFGSCSTAATGDKTITLNAAGLALVSKTGYTKLALRTSIDLDNGTPNANITGAKFASVTHATVAYRPILRVTYSEPSNPPSAPTINSLTPAQGKVTVAYTPAANTESVQVYRSTTNDSATATLIGTDTSSPYDDTTITESGTYYYWLKGVNAYGASAFSAAVSVAVTLVVPTLTATGTFDGKTLGTTVHGSVYMKAAAAGLTASQIQVLRAASAGGPYTDVTEHCTVTEPVADEFLVLDRRPQRGTPAIALGSTAYYKVGAAVTGGAAQSSVVSVVPATDKAGVLALRAAFLADNINDPALSDFSFNADERILCLADAMLHCDPADYATLKTALEARMAARTSTTPVTGNNMGEWVGADGIMRMRYPWDGVNYADRIHMDSNGRSAFFHYLSARLLSALGETTLAANALAHARSVTQGFFAHIVPTTETVNAVTRESYDLTYTTDTYAAYPESFAANKVACVCTSLAFAYTDPGSTLYQSSAVLAQIHNELDLCRAHQQASTGRQPWSEDLSYYHIGYGMWTGYLLAITKWLLDSVGQGYSAVDDQMSAASGFIKWFDTDYSSEPAFASYGKTGSVYVYPDQSQVDSDSPDAPAIVDAVYYMQNDQWALSGIDLTAAYNTPEGNCTSYSEFGAGTVVSDLDWTLWALTGYGAMDALLTDTYPVTGVHIALEVDGDVLVSFTNPATNEDGIRYKVDYGSGYGAPVTRATPDLTSFSFTPNPGWGSVKVAVCTYNADGGESAYSESNTIEVVVGSGVARRVVSEAISGSGSAWRTVGEQVAAASAAVRYVWESLAGSGSALRIISESVTGQGSAGRIIGEQVGVEGSALRIVWEAVAGLGSSRRSVSESVVGSSSGRRVVSEPVEGSGSAERLVALLVSGAGSAVRVVYEGVTHAADGVRIVSEAVVGAGSGVRIVEVLGSEAVIAVAYAVRTVFQHVEGSGSARRRVSENVTATSYGRRIVGYAVSGAGVALRIVRERVTGVGRAIRIVTRSATPTQGSRPVPSRGGRMSIEQKTGDMTSSQKTGSMGVDDQYGGRMR